MASILERTLSDIVRSINSLARRIGQLETVEVIRSYRGTSSQRGNTSLGFGNQAFFWDTDLLALYVWDDNDWQRVEGDYGAAITAAITGHAATADAHHNWPLLEGDIPATIARDSEVTSSISSHASDANAHHNWPLQESDIPSSIARDTEVTSAVSTHASDANAHHNWPLQESDIPSTIARDSEVTSAISTHASDANAHHAQQHNLDGSDHTGTLSWSKVDKSGSSLADLATRPHSALTSIGANDHHNQQHALDSSDHTGTLPWNDLSKSGSSLADLATKDHNDLDGLTSGDPHTQYLLKSALSSVGDIFVRGSSGIDRLPKGSNGQVLTVDTSESLDLKWETPSSGVTDHGALSGLGDDDHTQYHNNSRGDSRYYQQSEFDSSPGASGAPLETSGAGLLEIKGLALGKTASADNLTLAGNVLADGDLRAEGGIVTGSTSENPIAGRILIAESATPGTPPSGFGVLWVNTSGQLNFKNDSGSSVNLGP